MESTGRSGPDHPEPVQSAGKWRAGRGSGARGAHDSASLFRLAQPKPDDGPRHMRPC